MGEARGDLDLAEKALACQRLAELWFQYLERHLAVMAKVFGDVHCRHPARADLALEAVTIGQRGAQPFLDRGHRRRLMAPPAWRHAYRSARSGSVGAEHRDRLCLPSETDGRPG